MQRAWSGQLQSGSVVRPAFSLARVDRFPGTKENTTRYDVLFHSTAVLEASGCVHVPVYAVLQGCNCSTPSTRGILERSTRELKTCATTNRLKPGRCACFVPCRCTAELPWRSGWPRKSARIRPCRSSTSCPESSNPKHRKQRQLWAKRQQRRKFCTRHGRPVLVSTKRPVLFSDKTACLPIHHNGYHISAHCVSQMKPAEI